MQSTPSFVAVYNVINKNKRNASSRTVYKNAPKSVKSYHEAVCWYHDTIANRGMVSKRLVEIRESK